MRIKHCLLCLALAFSSAGVSAQTDDFGSWCSIQAIKVMGKALATVRVEHRSYQNLSSTQNYFVVLGGAYNFNKYLQAEGAYEYWNIPAAGKLESHRATMGLIGTVRRDALAVSLRGKYELCFNTLGNTPTSNTRWRLRAQYSIPESIFRPYVMAEMFHGFGSTRWIRSLHYVGTDIAFNRHNSIDLFYMYHIYPVNGGVGSCHVMGVGYYFIF